MPHGSIFTPARCLSSLLLIALTACGGAYDGGRGGDGNSGGPPGTGNPPGGGASACETLFSQSVQPRLEFCRTCHIPGGVGDVPEGDRFQLEADTSQDLQNLHASWLRLGGNANGPSRILTMASGTDARSHTGGQPWPVGSQAYNDVAAFLQGFDDPEACGLDGGSPTTPGDGSLLGSKRGGHIWAEFCADQPDTATLPPDPRELISTGSNAGRAVVFNIDWRSCHLNDALRPATCGEYRELYQIGELVGRGQGEVGAAHMFSGATPNGINTQDPSTWSFDASPYTISAEQYNSLWQYWDGYVLSPNPPARPDNFDALIAQRYGSPLGSSRNPYPLPGEDPNSSNGGSGQLPVAFTQLRDPADGAWTGMIGVKLCSLCHDGQLGQASDGADLGVIYGGAGTIGDFTVAFRDFAAAGAYAFGSVSGTAVTIAANRGTGAIDQFQIGFVAFNGGSFEELTNDKIVFSQAIGNIKSPPWWNMGHRPQKFHGAVLPTDSARIDMAAYYPLFSGFSGGDAVEWVDSVAYPFQIWAEAIKSPAYPGPIDTALAEQGAVLFHSKNLWAAELDNPSPQPPQPGNGSCASCHGVYSQRYAKDPAFLANPAMAGIAANLTPLEVIGTDPEYATAMQSLRNADGSPNAAANSNPFLECGLGSFAETSNNAPVMLAPPLFGIWASAPYFHNASVPNVWGVLDPASERPAIWLRNSNPAPTALADRVVMGFSTDLARDYDHEKLGWHYSELSCVENPVEAQAVLACNPAPVPVLAETETSPAQDVLGALYTAVALSWNLPADEIAVNPLTDRQIENRKVYNTNIYSQGNTGHEFTAVLTEAERRALIEYLKIL